MGVPMDISVRMFLEAVFLRGDQVRSPDGVDPRSLHTLLCRADGEWWSELREARDPDAASERVWSLAERRFRDPVLRETTLEDLRGFLARLVAKPNGKLMRKPAPSDLNYAGVVGFALLSLIAETRGVEPETLLAGIVERVASPPGRKGHRVELLSVGETAL